MVISDTKFWLWAPQPHLLSRCFVYEGQPIKRTLELKQRSESGLFQTIDKLMFCTKAHNKINRDYFKTVNYGNKLSSLSLKHDHICFITNNLEIIWENTNYLNMNKVCVCIPYKLQIWLYMIVNSCMSYMWLYRYSLCMKAYMFWICSWWGIWKYL